MKHVCAAASLFLFTTHQAWAVTTPVQHVKLSGQVTAFASGYGGNAFADVQSDGTYAHCTNLGSSETGYGSCEGLTQLTPSGLVFANDNQSISWDGGYVSTGTTTTVTLTVTNPACAPGRACQTVNAIASVINGANFGIFSGVDPYNGQIPAADNRTDLRHANVGTRAGATATVSFNVKDSSGTLYALGGSTGVTFNRPNCAGLNAAPGCAPGSAANSPGDNVAQLQSVLSGFAPTDGQGSNTHGYAWGDTPITIQLTDPLLPGQTRTFIYDVSVLTQNSTDCTTGYERNSQYWVSSCVSAFGYFGDPLGTKRPGSHVVAGGAFARPFDTPTLVSQFTPNNFVIVDGTLQIGTVPAPPAAGLLVFGAALTGWARRRRA